MVRFLCFQSIDYYTELSKGVLFVVQMRSLHIELVITEKKEAVSDHKCPFKRHSLAARQQNHR